MTVLRLGETALNPNMQIPELNQSVGIQQTNRPTIGGGLVVFQRKLLKGSTLQLIATEAQGWLDKTARDEVLAKSLEVGVIHTLTIADTTLKVMFDHSDGAAVDLQPFINRLKALEGDYFTGVIKLIIT